MNRHSNIPRNGSHFTSTQDVPPAMKKSLYHRGVNNPGVNSLVRGSGGVIDAQQQLSVNQSTFRKIDKVTTINVDKKGKTTITNNVQQADCPISMIDDILGKTVAKSVSKNVPVKKIVSPRVVKPVAKNVPVKPVVKNVPVNPRVVKPVSKPITHTNMKSVPVNKTVNPRAVRAVSKPITHTNMKSVPVKKTVNTRAVRPVSKPITKTVAKSTPVKFAAKPAVKSRVLPAKPQLTKSTQSRSVASRPVVKPVSRPITKKKLVNKSTPAKKAVVRKPAQLVSRQPARLHRNTIVMRIADNHNRHIIKGRVDRRPGVKRSIKVRSLVGYNTNHVGAVNYKPYLPSLHNSYVLSGYGSSNISPSVQSVVKDSGIARRGLVNPSKIATQTLKSQRRPQPKTLIRTIATPSNGSSRLPRHVDEDNEVTIRPNVQARMRSPLLPSPSINNLVNPPPTTPVEDKKEGKGSKIRKLSKRLSRGSGITLPPVFKSLIRPQLKIDSIDVNSNSTLSVKLSNVGSKDIIRVGLGGVSLASGTKLTDNGIYVESSQGNWYVKGLCNNPTKLCPVKSNHTITFLITKEYIDIHVNRANHIVHNFSLNYLPVVEANSESKASASYNVLE